MLHRLAKAEVSGIRQSRYKFGDPDSSLVWPYWHASSLGHFLQYRNTDAGSAYGVSTAAE